MSQQHYAGTVYRAAMSPALSFKGYCAALVRETASLRSRVRDADLALPVPTCPGWNLGHLLRHIV